MAVLTTFIEGRLRLKINQDKSAVARPETCHFSVSGCDRPRRSCSRSAPSGARWSGSASSRHDRGEARLSCILRINARLRGWHQFLRTASPGEQFTLRALDAHLRRRLRAIVLHHWRRRPTIVRKPHRPRCQATGSMAGWLLGPQVPAGAESYPASRSGSEQLALEWG
jgi:RNA-directed DNA polymerase